MQLDAFTFFAQIVNFIILLVLLRIFLYKPIINAMDEREEKIANRLREAEKKQEEAEQRAQSYQTKRDEIDEEREQILAEAREDAEQRREELYDKAQQEIEKKKQQWQESIEQEKDRFLRDLQERAETQIISMMRQVLSELANVKLEDQIIEMFSKQIEEDRDQVAKSLEDEDNRDITVYSAFELSEGQRNDIIELIDDNFSKVGEPQFKQDTDLMCGIALRTGSYEMGWNLKHYLKGLEGELRKTLDEEIESEEHRVESA